MRRLLLRLVLLSMLGTPLQAQAIVYGIQSCGFDPNTNAQLYLATYRSPFYPPDPVHVVNAGRMEVEMDQDGTMFTIGIDFASTTGEVLDPAALVGFNSQPEPPALGEGLGVFMPLSGGAGAPGSTQISLTLEILDGTLTPLPLEQVGIAVPALGAWAWVLTGLAVLTAAAPVRRRTDAVRGRTQH